MATIQISGFPVASSVADTDILHIQTGGIDNQATKLVLLQDIQTEVDANTASSGTNTTEISDAKKTIPFTGGGNLIAGLQPNELQDSNTYFLPLANSVASDTYIMVELPDKFSLQTPTVAVTGADTISYAGGTDTDAIFDGGTQQFRFTSDGVSDWRI